MMKTKQVLFAMFIGIGVMATACKRCQTCTKPGYSDVEVCKSAYTIPGMYKAQIESYEDSGYNCN